MAVCYISPALTNLVCLWDEPVRLYVYCFIFQLFFYKKTWMYKINLKHNIKFNKYLSFEFMK